VLLGLLLLWQVIFISGANILFLVAGKMPELASTAPVTEGTKVFRSWVSVTGQAQGWSLFAPFVTTRSVLVAVQLDGEKDGQGDVPKDELLSMFEPTDRNHYLHPFGVGRLSDHEAELGLVMWTSGVSEQQQPEDLRRALADNVRNNGPRIESYLRWRTSRWRRDHPEQPEPKQVILVARVYAIQPPGERHDEIWTGPTIVPLARWRTDGSGVEPYDPVTRRFQERGRD
jgi:hypothetical protein